MSRVEARVAPEPAGAFTSLDGEEFYRISAFDRMPPFLMSLASDTDLWMFVTSGGGLTAGRVDPDGSLFPYETVDRLHDGHHHTGPITLLRARRRDGPEVLWEPFSARPGDALHLERNLYKNTIGNRLVFEEIHHDLGLAFRYRWAASDAFGWVRTATLRNIGATPMVVAILDGLRNVLPHGAPLALYQQSSCLVDAYKRSEWDPRTGLGIFSLTAQILDRPEAAEELRANVVWCHGLPKFRVGLTLDAIAAFRQGRNHPEAGALTGRRGNYLAQASITLEPEARAKWHLVADAGLGHGQIGALRARLLAGEALDQAIEDDLERAREGLCRIVASADGLQFTEHAEATGHHFANVLFNTMRGGIFARNYEIPAADFAAFVQTRNRSVAARHEILLRSLPAEARMQDLVAAAAATGDADLERLSLEYLPLYFGRRHGDPSRPWNRFRIQVRHADGSRALHYEGNWRDIFQNWEALGLSFPGFLPGMIARFVNASTSDGFNPYRITRNGIDWEVVEPDSPWSNIGYWGDHQIIYLLRLLEALERHAPGELSGLLDREIFCHADVPYRLASYDALVAHPDSTIVFDREHAARIEARVRSLGSDGKLVPGPGGSIVHASLLEKLLIPALSKLSNLVPDGGIWMNTQRPEWNDANNALVGHGLSVVTLCHLRRYLDFVGRLLAARGDAPTPVASSVVRWFRQVRDLLAEHRSRLDSPTLDDRHRRRLMDALGRAFSAYREGVARDGMGDRDELAAGEVVALCQLANEYLDHAIRANRRPDGLYHSYNLLALGESGTTAAVHPLYEMLEGQVAALSSGMVTPAGAVDLLAALFASAMYRADQSTFMLYPERVLPGFLEKNLIPEESLRAAPLLADLLAAGDESILARDATGSLRFHADFRNARDLASALDGLARLDAWTERVANGRRAVEEVFERVFGHRSFTGRSGTMYGYEGLGCVYWHMVAKLLLAVQELVHGAARENAPPGVQRALVAHYDRIRDGLGFARTPAEFGAFPTDPYSHTPPQGGARQPGMTGQAKEEILTRFGELGVHVEDGFVRFRPLLLQPSEFRQRSGTWRFYDLSGTPRALEVSAGALAFSFCQVPVVYEATSAGASIRVTAADGTFAERPGDQLTVEESRALFERRGSLIRIDVRVPRAALDGQRK